MLEESGAEIRPTALAPVPAESALEEIDQPPIDPELAVIAPVKEPALAEIDPLIFAPVAVRIPVLVTLKGAAEAVEEPEYMATPPAVALGTSPTVLEPEPPTRALLDIDHAPIDPEVATTLPETLSVPLLPEIKLSDAEENLKFPTSSI